MWQITYMLGFLPDWLWTALFFVGVVLLVVSQFLRALPFVSSYRLPIIFVGFFTLMLSVWQLGAASNEVKWQERLKAAEKEKQDIEAKAKAANAELQAKLNDALGKVDDLRRINGQQASALANALKDGKATVQTIKETVVQNMTAEEKAVYDKMSAEQKADYDKKIADLLAQYKQCPNIPAFNIEEIEKKIRPPKRVEEKK